MIVIVIPAFNEATPLARLLPALPPRMHGRQVEPLVINDGSSDRTPDVARAHGVQVLDLWPNQGKSAALRAGLVAVRSRPSACVVFMDADGQHDPRELEHLVGPVLAGECDIASGSRYLADSGRGRTPLNRYLVRQAVVRSLRRRLGTLITDPFSGFRCVAPAVAKAWEPHGDRYEAELELLFDAVRNGWVLHEMAVARIYTGQCSKMGATRGPLVGRLDVLRQYAATIARKSDELAASPRGRVPRHTPGRELTDAGP